MTQKTRAPHHPPARGVRRAPPRGPRLTTPPNTGPGRTSRLRHEDESAADAPTRTMSVDRQLRDHSVTEAKRQNLLHAAILRNGFRDYVNGDLEPTRPVRAQYGQGSSKTTMSVRVDDDLWSRVLEKCDEDSDTRGWKVKPGDVATSILMRRFPLGGGQPAE